MGRILLLRIGSGPGLATVRYDLGHACIATCVAWNYSDGTACWRGKGEHVSWPFRVVGRGGAWGEVRDMVDWRVIGGWGRQRQEARRRCVKLPEGKGP